MFLSGMVSFFDTEILVGILLTKPKEKKRKQKKRRGKMKRKHWDLSFMATIRERAARTMK